jgi:anti-sigma factor RsiW
MKQDNEIVTEDDLHKFVDGELADAKAGIVAGAIAADESLKKRVDEYREINRRLREIYDEKQPGPLPARLLIAVSGRSGLPVGRIAASMVWFLVGGLLGYVLQGQLDSNEYVRPLPVEAAFAHAVYVPEVRHPVEVNATEQEHLNAWLSKRLARPIAAPDLRLAGYALIGGRLLPDAHRPAAQFMFEDSAGQRITLYIRHAHDGRASSFSYAESNEFGIVYWVDNGLAYALTAAADKAALTEAARIVYREVNP